MIMLYDTTLRDGTQGEAVTLTLQDKLRIAQILDEFGIHMIEGGWPGSNPKDVEFFVEARKLNLKHAQIAAFGSTHRPSLTADQDENLRLLVESEAPVCTIFGKSWTRHVTEVLRTTLDQNLRLIEDSVKYLKAAGRHVVYDAEHFFDGYRADSDYAVKVLKAAIAGGADCVVLCDTNGGMLPWLVEEIVTAVVPQLGVPVGVHVHNDSGCAVANTMAAVRSGCTHIQGTINGLGERCGNADLVPIIANLEIKLGEQVLPEGHLAWLTDVSHVISEIANLSPDISAPYVGRSAFAHKGGVHVAAIRRDSGSYEHCEPERVGNDRRVLISELSGRGNLNYKVTEYGLGDEHNEAATTVLARIKELENQGFAFEAAEASVELLMRRAKPNYEPFFELIDFIALVEHRDQRGLLAEATVKIKIGDAVHHTAAEGVGPVGALDKAMRKALCERYPEIREFRLVDYKVRILDGGSATAATTRVMIDTSDGDHTWTTVGASQNIIEASWQALFDSFEYGLIRAHGDYRPASVSRPDSDKAPQSVAV
jgi:2-isopropylmalate synthase